MARARKHEDYEKDLQQTVRVIVDKYIVKRPLPKAWGPNDTWRVPAAVGIVMAACIPELIDVKTDWGRDGSGEELPGQIDFCRRFAQSPDYFIRLIAHARGRFKAEGEIAIAMKYLRDGRLEERFSGAHRGRKPSDKEIALEIMRLRKMKDFRGESVGRARKRMVKEDKAIRNARIGRHLDLSLDLLPTSEEDKPAS